MMVKIILVLAACIAVCHNAAISTKAGDYTNFAYDVADPKTGDFKTHTESRIDGFVRGKYTVLEADGRKRIVDYTADNVNGFRAHVRIAPDFSNDISVASTLR